MDYIKQSQTALLIICGIIGLSYILRKTLASGKFFVRKVDMSIPTFTSPSVGTIPVVIDATDIFPTLSPTEQREFLKLLSGFRAQVEAKGDSITYLKAITGAKNISDIPGVKATVLDTCDWRIAQGLRYSTPTRIAEAVPHLERVIAHFESEHTDGQVDVVPELYLGVALHKTPGREEAAVAHFQTAYTFSPHIEMQFHTQLWSRACFSRLLRRMGRTVEAEEQENIIGSWLRGHPYAMPPDQFRELVSDPEHEGKDYILDHPMIENTLSGMLQLGPGMAIHFG